MDRRRRRLGLGTRLIVATVVMAAVVVPGAFAGSALVVRYDIPDPDAFIALGSHEWERLPAVAGLAGRAPDALVLLTEPVRPTTANCHLCPDRTAWLQALGVAADRIVVLPRRVQNTRDEAAAVAEYRLVRPIHRLVVVTSPYHARRALAAFASVLGSSVLVGVHPALEQSPATPGRWWRAPYDRAYVPYEWAALAWYALRYGVNPLVATVAAAPEEMGIQ